MTDYLELANQYINNDPILLFFGTFYIILGLSMFFASKSWAEFADLFVEHDSLSLVLGVLLLPIGLFIVFFFNNWDPISAIVLMVVGYLTFVKACALLIFPSFVQKFIAQDFVRKWVWLDGLSGIVLGLSMIVL